MRKTKGFLNLVVISIVAASMLTGCGTKSANNKADTNVAAATVKSNTDAGTEAGKNSSAKASSSASKEKIKLTNSIDYEAEFTLNGKNFSFPIKLQDFINAGYKIDSNQSSQNLVPNGGCIGMEIKNIEGKVIRITVYNKTDVKLPASECVVNCIEIIEKTHVF